MEVNARRAWADRMAAAAVELLDALDGDQRSAATWPFPAQDERTAWFYTPTDHHGLALADLTAPQQQRTHRLVASGLSTAGYVTAAVIIGLENVLDHVEGWRADFGRERGRDPQLYWVAVFGSPGPGRSWGWRFGGHHVSLNFTIVDGEVAGTTPLFFGADPASMPLLGPHPHRPLAGAEDLGRELVRSLAEPQLTAALLSPVAPSDIVTGNRPQVADGDGVLPLPLVFRQPLAEPTVTLMRDAQANADELSGITADQLAALTFRTQPKGVAVDGFSREQRELLLALLDVYLHRLPDDVADEEHARVVAGLDSLRFAWAGSTEPGRPHYYRLQGADLLVEYDNTQRDVNHVHTVWRDLRTDFGGDALADHYATAH